MVLGVVVPARTSTPITAQTFDKLQDYQSAVGGYIEPVEVPQLGVTLFANEEGLLRRLDFNSRATFFWWYHVAEVRNAMNLVGDVVIVGSSSHGDPTDLPFDVMAALTGTGVFRIEVRASDSADWKDMEVEYTNYFDALFWAMVFGERFNSDASKVVGEPRQAE